MLLEFSELLQACKAYGKRKNDTNGDWIYGYVWVEGEKFYIEGMEVDCETMTRKQPLDYKPPKRIKLPEPTPMEKCSVCGNEFPASFLIDNAETDNNGHLGARYTTYLIKCEKCGQTTKSYKIENNAIKFWNKANKA